MMNDKKTEQNTNQKKIFTDELWTVHALYGMKQITVSQLMDDLSNQVKSDPRMPRTRLRRYLGQYGMRGDALNAEVRRITAGPQRKDNLLKAGIYYTWPYGWEPADFTPMMRRIFKGKSTRRMMMFDELSMISNHMRNDRQKNISLVPEDCAGE